MFGAAERPSGKPSQMGKSNEIKSSRSVMKIHNLYIIYLCIYKYVYIYVYLRVYIYIYYIFKCDLVIRLI